jgi:hypothetical protein
MAHTASVATILRRPMPPAEVLCLETVLKGLTFAAGDELLGWIEAAFLADEGPLHDERFNHLREASIGCLWAAVENTRQGKRILATAEAPNLQGPKWSKARQEHQLCVWFGAVPDFIITIDALWAESANDREFCAVVDHELRHCVQARDEHGSPRFNKMTGRPVFAIQGHDVEEFQATVERYGIEAAGDAAVDLVIAAAKPATLSDTRIAQACGRVSERKVVVDAGAPGVRMRS